jgi:hypothetical protein
MTREKFTQILLTTASFCGFAIFVPSFIKASGPDPDDPFGVVLAPDGVRQINTDIFLATGDADGIGIFIFLSRILQLITVVAGLIILFNFISSGYTYLTAEGNPKAHETVRNRITFSVIGILIIVSAYTITGLLGLIFFGDASYILNPKIVPPTAP